jgi:hypothetical protein
MEDTELTVETPPEEGVREVEIKVGEREEGEAPRGEHEPPPDHPRFKQVYGKLKAQERENEELRRSMEEERAAAREHNRKLVEAVERLSTNTTRVVDRMEERQEKESASAIIGGLEDTLGELEERKIEALKDGDYKSVTRIDRDIRRVEKEIERVSSTPPPTKAAPPAQNGGEPDDLDPVIVKFVGDTPWFNRDPLMTGAAKELDLALSLSPKWKGKDLKERLSHVRATIEERFAWKGTRPQGGESGAGLPSGKPDSPTRVRLNDFQITVARGLGLTPEEYAHQLVLMGKGGAV